MVRQAGFVDGHVLPIGVLHHVEELAAEEVLVGDARAMGQFGRAGGFGMEDEGAGEAPLRFAVVVLFE